MSHEEPNRRNFPQPNASPSAAKVRILQNGSAMVSSATQDMGGGTYTTMT